MTGGCKRPVLILEGPGDRDAVPLVIRNLLYSHEIFDFNVQPNPIIDQNVPKLKRANELERFVRYARYREGDSVLILLDADENCPKEISEEFAARIHDLQVPHNVGLAFFKCEFEVFFLFCLDYIAVQYTEYGWNLDGWNFNDDLEDIVGAKGYISRRMKKGRSYKETRDQAKFSSVLDFDRLRHRSRSFRHFESTLLWLLENDENGSRVFPRL